MPKKEQQEWNYRDKAYLNAGFEIHKAHRFEIAESP
jgi:hypothetical protein